MCSGVTYGAFLQWTLDQHVGDTLDGGRDQWLFQLDKLIYPCGLYNVLGGVVILPGIAVRAMNRQSLTLVKILWTMSVDRDKRIARRAIVYCGNLLKNEVRNLCSSAKLSFPPCAKKVYCS